MTSADACWMAMSDVVAHAAYYALITRTEHALSLASGDKAWQDSSVALLRREADIHIDLAGLFDV